jgi:hypothetical protein
MEKYIARHTGMKSADISSIMQFVLKKKALFIFMVLDRVKGQTIIKSVAGRKFPLESRVFLQ